MEIYFHSRICLNGVQRDNVTFIFALYLWLEVGKTGIYQDPFRSVRVHLVTYSLNPFTSLTRRIPLCNYTLGLVFHIISYTYSPSSINQSINRYLLTCKLNSKNAYYKASTKKKHKYKNSTNTQNTKQTNKQTNKQTGNQKNSIDM
jgi:hypothetical protein